jgi:hypothetical protein
MPGALLADAKREEKKREEKKGSASLRSADGANGAPSPDETALDKLWRIGPKILLALTKLPDGTARKVLGRFVKQIDGDHATLLEILGKAEIEQPDDAVAWITAAIANRVGQLALSAPKDPYGIRAWTARQHDAKGDPPSINGYLVGVSAETIADAIGMPETWRGNWDALGE